MIFNLTNTDWLERAECETRKYIRSQYEDSREFMMLKPNAYA